MSFRNGRDPTLWDLMTAKKEDKTHYIEPGKRVLVMKYKEKNYYGDLLPNILRRDKAFKKEFGKRFDLMQTNSFKEFEYKPKQSKYFSQGKYPQSIIILNYIDIYGFKNEYIYI